MSRQSRKLHHLSMRMTIEQWQEPLWKGFKWKGKQKPPRSVLSGDIFSCLHTKDPRRRSIGFFYFPESLNICPDCRLSWDLNIWRLSFDINQEQLPFLERSEVLRQIWRRGVGLNMDWLWIKEHGHQRWIKYVLIVNRSQMSWSWVPSRQRRPCWGRILTRWRRDRVQSCMTSAGASAWHQQQIEQPSCHEIKRPGCHEINQLVVMRSSNLVTWDQATRMFE